jgi:hypothetical protein
VAVFEGRASVPVGKAFRKLFFRHPATKELYGHVDVGMWPLGVALYPLYYRCYLGMEIFPGMATHSGDSLAPPLPGWRVCGN